MSHVGKTYYLNVQPGVNKACDISYLGSRQALFTANKHP
jgi:hypothetical protein